MLNSLYIKNYRNLKELQIDSVAQVNLLCGKNNTGKSSVLEAIALFACGGDFDYIISLLNEHGYLNYKSPTLKKNEMAVQVLSSLFFGRKPEFFIDKGIKIEDDKSNFVKIGFFNYKGTNGLGFDRTPLTENDTILDNYKKNIGLQIENNTRVFSDVELEKLLSSDDKDYSFATDKFQFIQSGVVSKIDNGKLFDNIALKDSEDTVIEALKIIEPQTKRFTFVTSDDFLERKAVIKISSVDEIIPLSDLGDGINRILTIILAAVNCKNGFLLIDEFENGLHYTVQEQLWKIIFKLAKDLNIQVFTTTHSNDCIHSFSKVLNEEKNGVSGKLIRLDNKNGEIKATEYSAEDLRISVKHDIETR
jgi:AAA15 family ATPase/GTPase